MSITRSKLGGWGVGEKLTSSQANALDINVTNALDKRTGQSDTLASTVSLTGAIVAATGTISNGNINAAGYVQAKKLLTLATKASLKSITSLSVIQDDTFVYVRDTGLYRFDSSSTAAESSPYILRPDDSPVSGRWVLECPKTTTVGTFQTNRVISTVDNNYTGTFGGTYVDITTSPTEVTNSVFDITGVAGYVYDYTCNMSVHVSSADNRLITFETYLPDNTYVSTPLLLTGVTSYYVPVTIHVRTPAVNIGQLDEITTQVSCAAGGGTFTGQVVVKSLSVTVYKTSEL